MKTSLVAQSSPFKQEMLTPTECYILDNGVDSKIFLWKGMVKFYFDFLILHIYSLKLPSEIYTLDGRLWLYWQFHYHFNTSGPSANTEERKTAMKVAEQFIKDKNYPKNTQVSDANLFMEVDQIEAKF